MEQSRTHETQNLQGAEVLSLATVENLRATQKEIYDRRYDVDRGIDDSNALDEEMRQAVDDYLENAGIASEHTNYVLYRRYLDDWSYDNMSDTEWEYGVWENPEAASEDRVLIPGSSGRDRVERARQILLGSRIDHDQDSSIAIDADKPVNSDSDIDVRGELDDTVLTEAYLENARFDVSKSRDSWAKAASKRLGRAFSVKDKDREKLRDEYHKDVQELGKLELQAVLEDDSVSADEKNIAVITFLFDEQTRLREQTLENLKSTKVSCFVEWMNRGSVATRVAKGISIGALAGVTGGVLAGAAGAGVIAAGAVAGSRFVKGYASKDRHRGSKMPDKLDGVDLRSSHDTKLVLEHLSESNDTDILGSASDKVNSFFEDDIKDEQNERRKALGVGALSIVAGAGIGYGISNIGVLGDAKDAIHDKLGDWIGGNSNDGAPAPSQNVAPSGPAVEPSPPDTTDALNGRGDVFNGYMGTRALTPEAIDLMNEQLNGYTVKPGDSVWSLSEDFLQSQGIEHPTVYEIDATKDVLLKELRAEGLADARGWLSVGDTLRIT